MHCTPISAVDVLLSMKMGLAFWALLLLLSGISSTFITLSGSDIGGCKLPFAALDVDGCGDGDGGDGIGANDNDDDDDVDDGILT